MVPDWGTLSRPSALAGARLRGMAVSEITEWLERYRRGAELVAVAITGAAGSELDYCPEPGKWSVRQILCHLADSEIVAAERFRRVAAEDHPQLAAFDGDAWARNLDYGRRKIAQALETLRRTRAENYELLAGLPEEAWSRAGNHSELGAVTLAGLVRHGALHAEEHVRQIREVRARFRQARSGGVAPDASPA